jgi:multiple sugar transport system permease protein
MVTRAAGRRRSQAALRETLKAYAFLLPAGTLIFIFGLFPVVFAFFVSLNRWRRFPDQYLGLGNYHTALGDAAYVLFFWLGVAALAGALWLLWRGLRMTLLTPGERLGALGVLPGAAWAVALTLFGNWIFTLLPDVMNIPRKLIGQNTTQGLFVKTLFDTFALPDNTARGNLALAAIIAALVLSIGFISLRRSEGSALWSFIGAGLLTVVGLVALRLTLEAIGQASAAAAKAGTELPVWSQIIIIGAGAGLLALAYLLWTRSTRQGQSSRRMALMILAAAALVAGGYALIAYLPQALASADRDMLSGFSVTMMYAAFAVPLQLAIGLALAYLLFQRLKGTTLFRMVFFLPYIMPFVATSVIFTLLFSHRQDSIINHIIGAFGIPPQKWLLEPVGIFKLIFPALPDWAAGPGLALVVVIIYTVWTYSGYATVLFLAGLTNISGELYEAARIDGASGWQLFRYITFPLLSPTTFFLTLIATIGTFQAFTQIWIMRTPAAGRSMDTMSIVIFNTIQNTNPNYGYGAALSFVLFGVILLLTLAQNRFAGRRVFYG